MSANLVILYPHYLFSGNTLEFPAGETTHPASNVVTGARASFYRSLNAISSNTFATDIDSLEESEQTPNYIYIAGLNLSIAKGGLVNVKLVGSDTSDFASSTTPASALDVELGDLVGCKNEDFIIETTSPSQRRFWKGVVENGTGTSDFKYEFRKMYFGQWFDPIVDPDAPASQRYSNNGTRRSVRNFSLNWRGLSNVKLKEFTDRILLHRRYNPVILYARSWGGILNGENLIHARIINFTLERQRHDFNTIKVDFMEVI